MPRFLGKAASKEWKRITPLLIDLGLLSGLDLAALAMYCQAYGRLVELETAFDKMIQRFQAGAISQQDRELTAANADDRPEPGKTLDYAEAVLRASYGVTPSGYAQQSVAVQLIKSQREQVNRYLMHFGLSPAARGRVTPSNMVDPNMSLPGIEPAQQPGAAIQRAAGFGQFVPRVVQ